MARAAVVSPTRRWLTAIVTWAVAALLTVLSWPVGSLVAGLFGVVVGVSCRHWSPTARIALVLVGTCVAVWSAVVLADFSSGTTSVTA
ncbi:hypothetical protein [Microlunatus sagamiharensis]|uniref:hypothetical protein n=1 Tax=Microlunatus sagamiharensis TaxID=546874 RepID=UPI000B807CB9|nr:hypothetical protein [Microlunatus sagamiharensis]